ncbi:MAG: hypothetical protein OXG56_09555 [Gammaproteobacteria bacterium]|nr:hypothetical protein [Gammaproteobacteria bacterium]
MPRTKPLRIDGKAARDRHLAMMPFETPCRKRLGLPRDGGCRTEGSVTGQGRLLRVGC